MFGGENSKGYNETNNSDGVKRKARKYQTTNMII